MVFGCRDKSFGAFSFVKFGSYQVGYHVLPIQDRSALVWSVLNEIKDKLKFISAQLRFCWVQVQIQIQVRLSGYVVR